MRSDVSRVEWPARAPYRLLRNALTEGAPPPSGPIARLRRGDQTFDLPPMTSAAPTIQTVGHTELMANYAGQGVGLIHHILPAAAIMEQMVAEAESTLRALPALLA